MDRDSFEISVPEWDAFRWACGYERLNVLYDRLSWVYERLEGHIERLNVVIEHLTSFYERLNRINEPQPQFYSLPPSFRFPSLSKKKRPFN